MNENIQAKKKIFSGVQPSGNLTIGNYIGALRNFGIVQGDYDCFYCVVDMHSITVRQNPYELRSRIYDVLSLYLATGLDPAKTTLFVQSHVPAHAELAWVLNCFTYTGELSRMTQFKDKSQKQEENVNAGLFTYPVLMAADILLYQANGVPVGDDQKQHLEITRDIAIRFNNAYKPVFTVPEAFIPASGARIKSLQHPTDKMDKSDPDENASVRILDEPDVIMRKFKRAVTDSLAQITFDPENQPGVSNLLTIYCSFTGQSAEQALEYFEGRGYGDLKTQTAQAVAEGLANVRSEYKRIRADKSYLDGVMTEGARRACHQAQITLDKVYKCLGFVPKPVR